MRQTAGRNVRHGGRSACLLQPPFPQNSSIISRFLNFFQNSSIISSMLEMLEIIEEFWKFSDIVGIGEKGGHRH